MRALPITRYSWSTFMQTASPLVWVQPESGARMLPAERMGRGFAVHYMRSCRRLAREKAGKNLSTSGGVAKMHRSFSGLESESASDVFPEVSMPEAGWRGYTEHEYQMAFLFGTRSFSTTGSPRKIER